MTTALIPLSLIKIVIFLAVFLCSHQARVHAGRDFHHVQGSSRSWGLNGNPVTFHAVQQDNLPTKFRFDCCDSSFLNENGIFLASSSSSSGRAGFVRAESTSPGSFRGGGGGSAGAAAAASAATSNPTADLAHDIGRFVAISTQRLWSDTVRPFVMDPKRKILNPVQRFIDNQSEEAQKRREQYIQNPSIQATSSAIFLRPKRILKIIAVAYLMAEVLCRMGLIEGDQVAKTIQDAWDRAEPVLSAFRSRVLEIWRDTTDQDGGILRLSTWRDPSTLSRAWQSQLSPKVQWAVGAAVGMVISPALWTLGAASLRCAGILYVVAETHFAARDRIPPYEDAVLYATTTATTKGTDDNRILATSWLGQSQRYRDRDEEENPISSRARAVARSVDRSLEGLRDVVRGAVVDPKGAIFAIRRIDDRYDFPPDTQRGLIAGIVLGFVVGA